MRKKCADYQVTTAHLNKCVVKLEANERHRESRYLMNFIVMSLFSIHLHSD